MRIPIPIDLSLGEKLLQLPNDTKDIPIVMNGNAIGVLYDKTKGCLWLDVNPEFLVEKDKDGKFTSAKITALNVQVKEYDYMWNMRMED